MSAPDLIAQRAQSIRDGGELVSPCISVCRMSAATGLCEGCYRTLDEIAAWSRMGEPDKRAIWTLIEQRAAAQFPD